MVMPTSKNLTAAQREHLASLLAEMKIAESASQRFLGYLAKEHGVQLGEDGWLFDVENLCFVQERQREIDDLYARVFIADEVHLDGAENGKIGVG